MQKEVAKNFVISKPIVNFLITILLPQSTGVHLAYDALHLIELELHSIENTAHTRKAKRVQCRESGFRT